MRLPGFDELNPDWDNWRPVPSFKEFDDRWTGYHDPCTGVRLPYNPPIREVSHYHPETGFDDRCGACVEGRRLARER